MSSVETAASPAEPRPGFPLPLSRPVMTWVFLAAVAVAFAAETIAGGSTDTAVLVRLGAKVGPLIAAGEYWRLFTAMFLHIGWTHLFFNAYALVVIGTELERLLGAARFSWIYVLSGLAGSLLSYAFSPSLSVGASGAIFGVIGALATYFTLYRRRLGSWGRQRLVNVIFLIAVNLFFGFTRPGIDNWGHLGGLVAGLALGWALAPRYRLDPSAEQVVDANRPARYAPALLLAGLVLVAGTVSATWVQEDSPRSHLYRGQQAVEDEQWDTAVKEIELALDQDPDLADPAAYFYLGLARNHLDQPELAADAYEAALALDPKIDAAQWNLALTYLEMSRFADARAAFESYLRLNPDAGDEVQPYLEELNRLESDGA